MVKYSLNFSNTFKADIKQNILRWSEFFTLNTRMEKRRHEIKKLVIFNFLQIKDIVENKSSYNSLYYKINFMEITLISTTWKVSVFGVILFRILPHSDWMQRDTIWMGKNKDQNNSKYGHFSRSDQNVGKQY